MNCRAVRIRRSLTILSGASVSVGSEADVVDVKEDSSVAGVDIVVVVVEKLLWLSMVDWLSRVEGVEMEILL